MCCGEDRSPEHVQERLDRLIAEIKEIQAPMIHGGDAPDVVIVSDFSRQRDEIRHASVLGWVC